MVMESVNTLVQAPVLRGRKFSHPLVTATGEDRAQVDLVGVETLWFNTGTRCNIECPNCYIKSSPTNDSLVYLNRAEVEAYLREVRERNWPTSEIGFTGGEPFLNPHIIGMMEAALEHEFCVLVLTNAMRPMMRPRVQRGLLALREAHGSNLRIRVSIDHYTAELHDTERGEGKLCHNHQGNALAVGERLPDSGRRPFDVGRTGG